MHQKQCKWQKDFTSISERLSQMEPDLNLVNADFGNELGILSKNIF